MNECRDSEEMCFSIKNTDMKTMSSLLKRTPHGFTMLASTVWFQQVSMNVDGYNFFCMEEFTDTLPSCQMPFCQTVPLLLSRDNKM
jgi:hypothetical protein